MRPALKVTCWVAFLAVIWPLASRSALAPITVTPSSIPAAVVGTLYSQTFQATGGAGAPYEWSVALTGGGDLPDWLTPPMTGGTLSVTPPAAGTFLITVTARDSNGSVGHQAVSLLVTTKPVITTTTLASGQVGVPYSQPLNSSGGSGAYSWAATGLPPGLRVNPSGTPGALIGTPTFTGIYPSVQITVTDPVSSLSSPPMTFSITIAAPTPALNITPTTLPAGEVGVAYSQTLTATGGYLGSGTYTWSISQSAPLSFSSSGATAVLSSAGLSSPGSLPGFTVTVTDAAGDVFNQPYTVTVDSAVSITTSSLPNAAVGESWATQLKASGGIGSYTWTASGLPAWLNLGQTTGLLSGIPPAGISTSEPFNFSVTVTDSNQGANTVPLSLQVGMPIGYVTEDSTPGGLVFAPGDGSTPTTLQAALSGFDAGLDAGGNGVVATGTALKRITPFGGNVSTIASAPSGSSWVAVAADAFGNLIVGDNKRHGIWRVSPDGVSTVFLAPYTAANQGQTEDIAILADVHGSYIVAEDNGSAVSLFSVTPAGAISSVTLTGSPLPQTVGGLKFDQNGNYMLLDQKSQALFRITPQGVTTVFANTGIQAGSNGLARNPLTNEYVFGKASELFKISASGGNTTALTEGSPLTNVSAVATVTEDFPSTVDATNPLAYFRLETSTGASEVNGTYTYNLTGGQADSISSPGAPIGTASNNFALLDGSTGQVTTSLSGQINTAGSMMAWVNLSALPSVTGKISYIAGESAEGNDFDLQVETDNSVHFYTTCCNSSLSFTPNQATLAGQWHLVAATFDASAGKRAIYWDGALVKTDNVTSQTNKTGMFWIGNSSVFGNRNFNGGIDEVAVWNYAVTAPQVYRMFASRALGASVAVNSLSLTSALQNSSATPLNISGQNFAAGSTVWWTSPSGGTTILTPTSVAAGQIVVTIPAGQLTTPGIAEVSVVNPGGVPANQLPFTISYPPLSINPSSGTLSSGLTNQLYSQALTASGGSGNYAWSITTEAAGLNLSLGASTGAATSLTGTPTVSNTNPGLGVTVTLTDTMTGLTLPQAYTIPVKSILSISSSTTSIATTINGSVSASFTASGGTAPYTFSVSAQPPGVSISSGGASGSLSGTPTQAGTFFATLTATDAQNNSISTPVTISVLGLTTPSLPNGTAGQFYGASVSATGGTGGYTFSASGMPSGLSMSGSGSITGTALKGGTYPLSVTASSGGVSVTGSVSLTMANAQPLVITSTFLPKGTVNVAYSKTLSATGGIPPYTWATSGGSLPQGLSMSTSGIVSGTPTGDPGTTSFSVQITDMAGATGTATATIVILPIPLVITTQTLPSGMNGVDYPKQTLTANGGVGQYSWALSSGSSLPSTMVLSTDGVLSGVPGSTGTFSVGITVTDSATPTADTANATFQLTIRPSSADLILTASSLGFSLSNPSTSPPAAQTVGVQSTVSSQKISYTVAVNPTVPWLSLSNGATTPDTMQVSISSAALTLTAGDYPATITATCTSTSCKGHTQSVAVDLTVTATPPKLKVDTSLLAFATTSTETGTISQSIDVENIGGGTVDITSVSCETAWCSAGPAPAGVGGGSSVSIPVTLSPSLLAPGFYRTQVDIATSAGPGSVAVTLFIAANSTMTLSPQGAQFSMPAGGAPGNPNGSFLVGVNNSKPVTWTASVISGGDWFNLGTQGGTSSSAAPGTVSYSINPKGAAALAPGAHYGEIEITSPDVSNSPLDYEVVVNVTPANTPVTPNPQPGGLLFITSVGGLSPPQAVTVYSSSATPSTFQANAATTDGTPWLSVTPATGPASSDTPGATLVGVDTTGLTAGVYYGGVSYSLSAAAVVTVSVTLIVTPEPGASSASAVSPSFTSHAVPRAAGTQAAASCSPTVLVPAQTGLVNSFSAPAGWPTALAILLYSNCGTVVTNGQVVATFSNGDPPLALALANPSQGLYSGTWSPAKTASQVSITVQATAPGFPAATSKISGAVVPNAVPVLTPHGTVHSFDPLVGGPLAPGTIVAIYGQNLAATTAQPTTIPLPTTFGGSSVAIGGMAAPLYYVSPTQINAQIPFELQPGQQYQVIVSTGSALTTPNSIQLSPATPGLAAFPDGTLIAQHNDGSLVTAASPAQAGEYLVAYLAGMGATTVPVASGAPSPGDPLARPLAADAPVLTINGATYPIYFAGLTPGLVGLYQMNFEVPTGLPAGNITITVSQNDQSSNQTTLPYQP